MCLEASEMTCQAAAESQVFEVPLKQRLINLDNFASVWRNLRTLTYEAVLISAEGRVFRARKPLLANMSETFRDFLSKSSHSSDGECEPFRTGVSAAALEEVLPFLTFGFIRISAETAQPILEAALYLRIGCLLKVCREFLREHWVELLDVVLHWGGICCEMRDIAEEAIQTICKAPSQYAYRLARLDGWLLFRVISRDEFAVESEDDVVDLVTLWRNQGEKRFFREIHAVLECVRYEFLSKSWRGLPRLKGTFDDVGDLHERLQTRVWHPRNPPMKKTSWADIMEADSS